nr:proline-rich receptor-like protein kinase PERK8 [Lolium perenne]
MMRAWWSGPLLTRAVDEHDFEEVVDPLLADNFADVKMFWHSAARRLKIGQVVRILESPTLKNVDLTNDMQTGMNQMFNVTADSVKF